MKKLFSLFLKLFGGKKTFDLDGDGKVEVLREELAGVFSQFKKMSEQIEKVNNDLQDVIEEEQLAKVVEEEKLKEIIAEAERKLAKSDKIIGKASLEIQANEKLKEKVSEFII